MHESGVSVTAEPDGIAVVSLTGEHDLSSADRVREALAAVADAPATVVDLTRTQFIDSSILGVFVEACRAAQAAVRRVLELTGITTVVVAHDFTEAAVAASREADLRLVDDD